MSSNSIILLGAAITLALQPLFWSFLNISQPPPPALLDYPVRAAPWERSERQHHIVVAHCVDDISWLDQLHTFDPSVCTHTHIHIYSKCGTEVDLMKTIPSVAECATLHRIHNCGIEEYVYLRYIEDRYDSMPPKVSFVQGGAITENPHIIYDMMVNIPGLTFKDLSRFVLHVCHWADYKKEEKAKNEKEIVMSAI